MACELAALSNAWPDRYTGSRVWAGGRAFGSQACMMACELKGRLGCVAWPDRYTGSTACKKEFTEATSKLL